MNVIDIDKHRGREDSIKLLEKKFDEILSKLNQHTPLTRAQISTIKATAETRYRRQHRFAFAAGGVGAAMILASFLRAGYLDYVHASGLPAVLPFTIGMATVLTAWFLEHRAEESRQLSMWRCEPAHPSDVERVAKMAEQSPQVRRAVSNWLAINPILTRREFFAVEHCIEELRVLEPSLHLNRALQKR